MLIKSASFINLHGHITQNLNFWDDVNILIGVNGSGKTTFLNAIAWTLSPESVQGGLQAAYLLSMLEFDVIMITFKLPGIRKYQRVTANKNADNVSICATDVEGNLQIPVIPHDDRINPTRLRGRGSDDAIDIIARHLNEQRTNPVFQYLSKLQGPLYLPLDRRWPETEETRFRRPRNRRIISVDDLPINDVLRYADRVHRREQILIAELNDELRTKLLASLFEAPDPNEFSSRTKVLPIEELKSQRESITLTLSRLGLPGAEKAANSFYDTLEDTANQLEGRDFDKLKPEDPLFSTWIDWVIHSAPLAKRAERLVPFIEEYEAKRTSVTNPSRSFLESVNGFLSDSGKRLEFSDRESLMVRLPNGKNTNAANLSSGELQLLILFTFLYFRFEEQEQFTIIIDEPELSLHLAWQSRYLQAITKPNQYAQFIVATHSPEIAGPFEERIIDISPPGEARASL